MISPQSKPLLLLLLLGGALCLGAALYWQLGQTPKATLTPLVRPPSAGPATAAPGSSQAEEPMRAFELELEPEVEHASDTSVIWPLEVQLTLVSSSAFDKREGVAPPGEGANAALQGHVWGPSDEGLRATVQFVHGSNQGRKLSCDGEGAFGASDLYPGLNIVRIETPLGLCAEREVRLRSRQEELLNLGFGRPAVVYGSVLDLDGKPIVGAEVTLDGLFAQTDVEGIFHFPSVASGLALASAYKSGYARYRESVPITAGRIIEHDKLVFRLAPGASLELVVEGAAGNLRSPTLIYLFPIGPERVNTLRGQQTYPWHLVSPIEIYPGGSRVIDGLADGHVAVAAFRPGAITEPKSAKVRVYAGRTVQQVVRLLPGPTIRGRALRAGKAVEGARVRLEAPNRQRASEVVLQKTPEFNQELVFPHLPAGIQEVLSDSEGRFQFTVFPEISNGYYLTAETLDGLWRGGRSVSGDGGIEVDLELERVTTQARRLEIGLSARFQALPVAVRVDGAPRDRVLLGARQTVLEINELEAGTWRLDVDWHDEKLLDNVLVQVGAEQQAQPFVKLPQGAVDGQSPEERKRAGR